MGRDTEFNYGFNTEEIVTYDCTCAIICPVCRRRFGLCTEVHEQLTRKGENNVNVAQYVKGAKGGSGDFNPFITAKDVGKSARLKVIGVRELHTPPRKATKDKKASSGFDGLMVDLKNGTKKYCLPLRFDRPIDLSNFCAQMKSEDTDDWMGNTVKLITAKGKKGGSFVNVARK